MMELRAAGDCGRAHATAGAIDGHTRKLQIGLAQNLMTVAAL
jgi:hypothetical protein